MTTGAGGSGFWLKSCMLALLAVFVAGAAQAATNLWVGLGGNVNWSTPGNWTNGVVPVGASDLVIQMAGNTNLGVTATPLNQDVANPLDLNRLATVDVAGSIDVQVYLSGGRLNFVTNGAAQPTLLHDREQTLYVRAPVSFPAGVTLAITNRTYGIDFESVITGAGGLGFWSGSAGGEMSLKNTTNSYSGGTLYANTYGANAQYTRLYVYTTSALGTGPVTLNGGNLTPLSSGNQNAGGLTFMGTTAPTNDFVLLGTSPLFAGSGLTNETVAAASVTLSGGFNLNASTLYLRGQRGTSGTISGVIAGTGSAAIVKMDLGPWTLSGANTFTGRVTVSNGTLKLGVANAVLPTVPLTVNGGTYDLNGFTVTNDVVTVSGGAVSNGTLCAASVAGTDAGTVYAALSGTNGVSKSGAGILTLSGTDSYTGATTVNAGILEFAKRVALYNADTTQWTTTTIIVNSGAALAFNVGGTDEFTDSDIGLLSVLGSASGGFRSGSVLGFDTTNAAGGVFTSTSVIGNPGGNMLGLQKLGLGTLTLGSANSYTGATRITGGVLSVGALANGGAASGIGASSNAPANLVFDGGTLRYTGATASTDRRFTIVSGKSAVFDVSQAGATLTFASILGSSGLSGSVITKNGPGTLTFGYDGPGGSAGSFITSIDCLVINGGSYLNVAGDTPQLNVGRLAAAGPALVLGDGAFLGASAPVDNNGSNTEQVIRYTGTNATATIAAGLLSGPGNGGSNTKTFDVNDGTADIDLLVSASYSIYSGVANPAVSDIRKTGAGTLKLSGAASDFRGMTTVRNGRIVVGGNVAYGAQGPLGNSTQTVQVADAGTTSSNTVALVFDGSYTFGRGIVVYPYTNGASVSVGSVATNSAVFSGAILLSNTVQLTSASAGTNAVIVTGVVSGPGGVTKTGTGTVVLAAANTYTGQTTVAAGTLRLPASDRINDASGLRFTGGTFDTAGFSETMGELDVDGAAVIDFGSGSSTLRFAASTGQTWTGTLTLRNWTGTTNGSGTDRLYVGASSGGLTATQLAKITLADGRKVLQLATGEVVPVPKGILMTVR